MLPVDPEAQLDEAISGMLSSAPPEAWVAAVTTAGGIVKDILAPLTSTTAGLGRLIQTKFDGFIEVQRVLAADTLRRTNEKILAAGTTMKEGFNPAVVIPCLDESSKQVEQEMRDLWANLLARELTGGGIHPEFPRVLARLTSDDANELVKISKSSRRWFLKSITRNRGKPAPRLFRRADPSLSEEVLRAAGLVERDEAGTKLTGLGRAFLNAVAPFEKEQPAASPEEEPD